MRMVPDGPDHPSTPPMSVIESYARSLDVPVELVWGRSDPILGPGLPAMQALFPQAPVTETEAGHFLQEEVPDVIGAAIMRVVDEVAGPDDADVSPVHTPSDSRPSSSSSSRSN
jgi:haloalkane dehalogenase